MHRLDRRAFVLLATAAVPVLVVGSAKAKPFLRKQDHASPQDAPPPEPTLTGVKATMGVTGDGLDSDSRLNFNFVAPDGKTVVALYSIANTSIGDYDTVTKDLDLKLNPPKSDTANSFFQLDIQSGTHDHIQGTLQVYFTYSDGTSLGFAYGSFGIGTYKESNTDRRAVTNVTPG